MASRAQGGIRTTGDAKADAKRVEGWRSYLSGRCQTCLQRDCDRHSARFPTYYLESDEDPSTVIDLKTMTFKDANGTGLDDLLRDLVDSNDIEKPEPLPPVPGDVMENVLRNLNKPPNKHSASISSEQRPPGERRNQVGYATEVATRLSFRSQGFTRDELDDETSSGPGPSANVITHMIRAKTIFDTGEKRDGLPVFKHIRLKDQVSEPIEAKETPKKKPPKPPEPDDEEIVFEPDDQGADYEDEVEEEPEEIVVENFDDPEDDICRFEEDGPESEHLTLDDFLEPEDGRKPEAIEGPRIELKPTHSTSKLNGDHAPSFKEEWIRLAFEISNLRADLDDLDKKRMKDRLLELSERCMKLGGIPL